MPLASHCSLAIQHNIVPATISRVVSQDDVSQYEVLVAGVTLWAFGGVLSSMTGSPLH